MVGLDGIKLPTSFPLQRPSPVTSHHIMFHTSASLAMFFFLLRTSPLGTSVHDAFHRGDRVSRGWQLDMMIDAEVPLKMVPPTQ